MRSTFSNFMTLRDAMNQLMEESLARPESRRTIEQPYMRLPLDAWVTDDAVIIEASLPGVKPEDVAITLEGDTLSITTELPKPEHEGHQALNERRFGKIGRDLVLNIPVETQKAEANFSNGVLTLVIPKKEELRPHTIKVKVK